VLAAAEVHKVNEVYKVQIQFLVQLHLPVAVTAVHIMTQLVNLIQAMQEVPAVQVAEKAAQLDPQVEQEILHQ